MEIRIFDVEHGGCALISTNNGRHILVDCGHNSTSGWRPSDHLLRNGIRELDMLMVTNYDEDHVSDLRNVYNKLRPAILYRNETVSSSSLLHLKELGGTGPGIDTLSRMMADYAYTSLDAGWGGLSWQTFHNRYPVDFEDENNLSLVVIFSFGSLVIAFPGDMEIAGWRKLLERKEFRTAIARVNVLVASHHGRANGCCDELYTVAGMNPLLTIISDSGIQYATQDTIKWYRQRTRGGYVGQVVRRVLTTRSDGRIRIDARADGFFVHTQQY